MTSTAVPLGRMLALFLGLLFACNVALAVVSYAFPDLSIPSSLGIVLAMVAAMNAGQSGTKAVNRRLTFGEKAAFALLATGLSSLLGVALILGSFSWYSVPLTLENLILVLTGDRISAADIAAILTWVIPAVLVVYLLVTYLGVAMGSRTQMKLQEKLAAKGN